MDVKIVDKIQKLLALSKSSNVHEAELSMLKAQELLARHKLTLKEVKEFNINSNTIKENKTKVSFTKAKWKAQLAQVIADNFGCYRYYKTRGTNTITFFGREEDVTVCSIVLEYAVDCIYSAVKKLRYQYLKQGYSTKGLENDYAIGFICGLKEKFEQQKRANKEWGLVLVKDNEVVKAYNLIKFKKKINTSTKFQGYLEIYEKGHKDGKEFSISNKITECNTDETLVLTSGTSKG